MESPGSPASDQTPTRQALSLRSQLGPSGLESFHSSSCRPPGSKAHQGNLGNPGNPNMGCPLSVTPVHVNHHRHGLVQGHLGGPILPLCGYISKKPMRSKVTRQFEGFQKNKRKHVFFSIQSHGSSVSVVYNGLPQIKKKHGFHAFQIPTYLPRP